MASEKIPLLKADKSRVKSHQNFVLVIHGGAGTMLRERSTPEQRQSYKTALVDALQAGYVVLEQGGDAMDAAVAAVTSMENCPLFNSAKGAVFNVAGKNELETSIMTSKPPSTHPEIPATRRGMSVTLLTRAKNPSQLVRALYLSPDKVEHPFLSGSTAEELGEKLGAELVDPSYFYTEARWLEHRRGLGLPDEPLPHHQEPSHDSLPLLDLMPTGTVGAVALDVRGALCAVTSTGGRTNKLVGRVGDTPHMGAGFWAEEWQITGPLRRAWRKITHRPNTQGVAISGTGDGDYFIRENAAATIAHRMQYLNETVSEASSHVVKDLFQAGGLGGVICVDANGNVALPLNCSGMYRGVVRADGVVRTAIFDDDELEEM